MEYFDNQTDTLYETTKEDVADSCYGCAGRSNSRLCDAFISELCCSQERVIWIKSEKITFSTDQSSQKITFSSEQIKYLQEVFQIDVTQEVLPVKDGFVKKGDTIWWECEDGPEEVKAEKDWDNIKEFPQYYSIKEPRYRIVYGN